MKKLALRLFTILALCAPHAIHCQPSELKLPMMLEVTAETLNVRDRPPWFSFSTIFTFKYIVNPPIGTLSKGTKVRAEEQSVIGTGQTWFRVVYETNNASISGWVYGGPEDNLINVRPLPDAKVTVTPIHHTNPRYAASPLAQFVDVINLAIPSAVAQGALPPSTTAAEPLAAPPVQVAVVVLCYVLAFVVSFVIFHRVTGDRGMTIFGSLSVLLILGALTSETFAKLAAPLIAR